MISNISYSNSFFKLKRDKYMNTMSNYFMLRERVENIPSTFSKKLEKWLGMDEYDYIIKDNDSIEIFNEISDSEFGFNTIVSVPSSKTYSELNDYISTISNNSTAVMMSNLKYQHLDIKDKLNPKNNLYFLTIGSYTDLEGLDKRLKVIIDSSDVRIYSFLVKDK